MSSSEKAKFLWHCRRGMLELDLILRRFVESQIDHLTPPQIDTFEELLHCTDPELFSWLMGHETPIDKELADFVEFIRLQDKVS
ncbi:MULTISPECIES: succinate dehydrogenase assembly factor 2 [Legionella]|uniref:FAD assembly factor SdhE n=1 Tax=Legionella TaxID=445 RepID=UPI00187DD9CA|nr:MULTISPECIES: succinate dehydrogenase assembly factor 2 [Legionella]